MEIQAGFAKKGFTLAEMLIVLTIIGILFSIVIPTFSNYARETKRSEGKAFLMEILQKQANYFIEESTYTTDFRDLGYNGRFWITSDTGKYKVTAASCGGVTPTSQCVRLLAFPKGSTSADFSANTRGRRLPADAWP